MNLITSYPTICWVLLWRRTASFVFALFSLVWCLLVADIACAQRLTVTASNVGQFRQVSFSVPFFTCYAGNAGSKIGTINRGPLARGRIWSSFSVRRATSTVTSLKKRIASLSAKRRKQARTLKTLRKQLAWWSKATAQFDSFANVCVLQQPTPTPTAGGAPWEEPPAPVNGEFIGNPDSLSPYRNSLTPHEVRHILDKVAFGGSEELYQLGINSGLTALVDALVEGISTESDRAQLDAESKKWAARAYYSNDEDPELKGALIWTTEVAQVGQFYRTIFSKDPLPEWMLLQLSAHFAVNLNQIGFSYSDFNGPGIGRYWKLLRDNSLGNFSSLAKGFLTDPAMNFWLNNKDNRVGEPNQNFARELLELFLLGAIDPVTHTPNYGEESVVAATAFLSGYYEVNAPDPITARDAVEISYSSSQHDNTPYPLFPGIPTAARNQSFSPEGLIDHILHTHPSAPRYLAERFGGLVLYPGLSEAIVSQLADTLLTSNYELKPLLKRVLLSEAMFSESSRSSCITSPLELFFKIARRIPPALRESGELSDMSFWTFYNSIAATREAGQSMFEPPSVFGWKGSCNINRAGVTARGEGWLTNQRQLNLQHVCTTYMNHLNELKVDFSSIFKLSVSDSPEQIASKIYYALFWAPVPEEARRMLANFLITERDENNVTTVVAPNLSEEYYIRRKIPRLVCTMTTLLDSMRR